MQIKQERGSNAEHNINHLRERKNRREGDREGGRKGGSEEEKKKKRKKKGGNPNILRPEIGLGPFMSKYSKTLSQLDLVSLVEHSSQVSLEVSTSH